MLFEWQDRIGPLSNNNTGLTDSHIKDGLLWDAGISVQDLMKQEEIIDKDKVLSHGLIGGRRSLISIFIMARQPISKFVAIYIGFWYILFQRT
jgi:hypothetical protein